MTFPKQIMRLSELTEMGFPEELLMRAYRSPKQTFASKIDPRKLNSPILFDTEGLKGWWEKQIALQVQTMPR